MDASPTDPTRSGASVLAADLRALMGRLKRRLREQADTGDLTPSQTAVLLRLERDGPATVSALSRAEGVRPQSMRLTVAALEAVGHVEGRPDPTDGRQTIISLTAACRRQIADGRAARQDWLARALAGKLSLEEQETLATAVALLDRVVDGGGALPAATEEPGKEPTHARDHA